VAGGLFPSLNSARKASTSDLGDYANITKALRKELAEKKSIVPISRSAPAAFYPA